MKYFKNNTRLMIPLLLVTLIVIIIFSIVPSVKTIEVHYGNYENKIGFKGLFFVQEKIMYSGDTKGIKFNFKNGEKISKGVKIGGDIVATEAGIVIYDLDGYENKYTINNIKDIELKDIEELIQKKPRLPGVKILNNSQWLLCASVDENEEENLKKGSSKDIVINSKYYSAVITDIFKNSSGLFIVLRIKNDIDITSFNRGVTGEIIKSKSNGAILPIEALVEREGEKGVFIVKNGYAYFRGTKSFEILKDSVVIFSDSSSNIVLKEYDKVILNPNGLEHGDKVR